MMTDRSVTAHVKSQHKVELIVEEGVMKGIVFTELIEMVEEDLGIEIADRMISGAKTSNDGSYTSVGTYDHAELIQLVISLSAETGIPVPDLVQAFGKHLFARFHELYPQFFAGIDSAIDFLPMVEAYIHVEVRKLYPDAELPSFQCETSGEMLSMTYQSKRPFADLAEGLIAACITHFGDPIDMTRKDLGAQDGTQACFLLRPTSDVPAEEVAV
ncbi:Heme NO binding protein [Rubripirellula amarantea]|uniref:Heme NO binding protein n=1 Tax=Rubripirellula amarantea TaxID=2527999 RepID=A0A5C5WIW5_9BACT|nr:heme NO-binding domain-containing protein [Rubripirellula amarantea]TWT50560.1 Heme NO binding protein [Rubripirellula amarantea]